jgi:hypothetical protein
MHENNGVSAPRTPFRQWPLHRQVFLVYAAALTVVWLGAVAHFPPAESALLVLIVGGYVVMSYYAAPRLLTCKWSPAVRKMLLMVAPVTMIFYLIALSAAIVGDWIFGE